MLKRKGGTGDAGSAEEAGATRGAPSVPVASVAIMERARRAVEEQFSSEMPKGPLSAAIARAFA